MEADIQCAKLKEVAVFLYKKKELGSNLTPKANPIFLYLPTINEEKKEILLNINETIT